MQQPTTMSTDSPLLRQGLLFGLILGLVLAVIDVITSFVDLGGAGLAVSSVTFLLALAVYFFAGMRASQQTGKLTTGLLAGLWAGLISSLISFLATLLITITTIDAIRARLEAVSRQQHVQIQYTTSLIIGSAG